PSSTTPIATTWRRPSLPPAASSPVPVPPARNALASSFDIRRLTSGQPESGGPREARRTRRSRGAGLGYLARAFVGVVGAANERACGDRLEAELAGGALELAELVRVPIAHDRQVTLRRPPVLADGQDLDAVLAEDRERLDHLVEVLAEAH